MQTATICTHVPKLCDGLMKYGKWVMISLSVTESFLDTRRSLEADAVIERL